MSFVIKPEEEFVPPNATPIVPGAVLGKTDDKQLSNVALGRNAHENIFSSSLGNVAIGDNAMRCPVQDENTAIGNGAMEFGLGNGSQYASRNIAIGSNAMRYFGNAERNIAIGQNALSSFNNSGDHNIAIGQNSISSNTSGTENIAIGKDSLSLNTTGNGNIAIGSNALYFNTTGTENVALGQGALYRCTTGYVNTAFGYYAASYNRTGHSNVAIGYFALNENEGGSSNVAIGREALSDTGSDINNNVAVGSGAAIRCSGNGVTAIGYNAGFTSSSATGSNNTVIGNSAAQSSLSVSNEITLGNSSVETLRCQVTSITSLSDARDKQNIETSEFGIDLINMLRPVTFEWNMRDGGKVGQRDIGFIAQELVEVEDSFNAHETLALTYRENPEKLEASYGRLVPVLVKAAQELAAQVKELSAEVAALKAAK